MSQSAAVGMWRRSVHLSTHFFVGKHDIVVNQYFVHILLLVTVTS